MFRHLFARRSETRSTRRRTDRRSGAPVRHNPDPMPRIRWYA